MKKMNVIGARVVGTVLSLSLCLWPGFASASVSLPFATTYNCAEQVQGTPTWVTCGGIGSSGDWTTSNGSKEQITTAANYPGGGGGRGQRHWIGQSSGNTNGSGGVSFSFPQVQEIYIRWYVRWQAGLKLGGNAPPIDLEHKVLYFTGGGCGQAGGCYFAIQRTHLRFVFNGNVYQSSGGTGWDSMFGGGANAASDGRWIRLEIHLKLETAGFNNGIAQFWVDTTPVLNATTVDTGSSTGFSGFSLPENHQFTTVGGADMFEDLDDVAIRTTGPIGPIGAPPAPAPPSNLRLQ